MGLPDKPKVLSRDWWVVTLAVVILVLFGVFLRVFHLEDWLHFELDQARDALVIDEALLGSPLDLPLLGPKAGGTFLRLGPGFYWLEYLGARVFGESILGSVWVVTLSSIASILLFYWLARRFFSTGASLALTLLMSVSAFLVLYGRFAWNPNLIPFFSLLGMYALLRVVDRQEKYAGRWLLVAALAIGFATHMHFLAFLALPTIAGLFLLWRRPRIALRFWLGAFAIVLTLYVPMILNEIETGGMNTREFIGAISEKSTKEEHSLLEKTARNVSEFSLHGFVLLTGFEGAALPSLVVEKGKWESVCQGRCDEGKPYGIVAFVFLSCMVLSLLWLWWRETDRRKEDVLLLSLLWLGVTFVLFLPLAYGIAPRFFLLNAPVFFLLLGFLWRALSSLLPKRYHSGMTVLWIGVLCLAASNLYFLAERFEQLRLAPTESVENSPDRILKERVRVTLKQQNAIADFLAERASEANVPLYMTGEPQYRRSLKYLLEQRGVESISPKVDQVYRQSVSFVVLRTQSNHDAGLEKYRTAYTRGKTVSFGTLSVFELVPRLERITGERQDFSLIEESRSQAPPRYTLRQFLNRNHPGLDATEDEENPEDEEESE